MLIYILRRVGFLGLTLIITSLIVFLISQVIPGDVCRVILGREAGEAALENCRIELGFVDEDSQPIPAARRYLIWLTDFIQGDWGTSFATGEEIQPWVIDRLRNSLMLSALVLLISVPLAIFLGVLAGLNEGRWIDTGISIGSLSVGLAQAAFEAAVEYAKEREAFGKPIAARQAIQWMLADAATEIEAARLMMRQAAWLHENGRPFSQAAAMGKLFATEMAERIARNAIQIHGGYGYSREYPVERIYKDARLMTIGEGTSEIQRLVIARNILKG